jgi:heat shock protein HslJ
MKIVFSLIVLFICSSECHQNHSQNSIQAQDDMMITYEASTRGFYEKTWITKDSVSFSSDRSLATITVVKCESSVWESLMALIKDINVNELPGLEAPTKMYQVDGAAMATLKIEMNNEVFETNIFDHGHPPKAISKLVNKVLSIKEEMAKH